MMRLFKEPFAVWDALHPTVAATLAGIFCALVLSAAGAHELASRLPFSAILLRGLLPFLLFAGALHIDPPGLRQEGSFIALLSVSGVVVSTIFVGYALRWTLLLLGHDVSLLTCLLFGALISPTDPVAVLAIFRRVKVPRSLAITVGAESLFNDGLAVVMFASIAGAAKGTAIEPLRAGLLFVKQTGGGLICGLLLGELAARAVDGLETLPLRLAATALIAFSGYAGVNALGVSGLLATIAAGIRVGARNLKLKAWWTMIDGWLNVAVFFLLGLCFLQVPWARTAAAVGALAVPLVLAGRAFSVALPMALMSPWKRFVSGTFRALTWGGLRGAIPLALALTLPQGPERALVLNATYIVGVFSLVVQGSTL